jgi:hypothetical protein
MDSRKFIEDAGYLIKDIKAFRAAELEPEHELIAGTLLQKRINEAFSILYNPTLPSAFKLRNAALSAGFFVDMQSQLQLDMAWFDAPVVES